MPAAVTDPYAFVADYRAVASNTDSGEEDEILRDLIATSRGLDKRLHRFFTQDAAAVTRTYRVPRATGRAIHTLFVDDLADASAITSIKIDQDRNGSFDDAIALAAADFLLSPENADQGPDPHPFYAIELTPWGTIRQWPPGVLVEVVAMFGWDAVPAAIVTATIELTRILRLESPRAMRTIQLGLDTIVETSREAKEIVLKLVKDYGRAEI